MQRTRINLQQVQLNSATGEGLAAWLATTYLPLDRLCLPKGQHVDSGCSEGDFVVSTERRPTWCSSTHERQAGPNTHGPKCATALQCPPAARNR